MVEYTIAFDIDGVIRSFRDDSEVIPIEYIRFMIVTFSKFKNVRVVAHSARGKEYATEVIREAGLSTYIKEVYTKGDIVPDIAIDDQHEFLLGKINLIYSEHMKKQMSSW